MKPGFHLKLAIGLIVIFGLLFLGMLMYEPMWWKVQEWRLCSEKEGTRVAAAKAVAAKGGVSY